MKTFNMVCVGRRMRDLRTGKDWTLLQMARELNKRLEIFNTDGRKRVLTLTDENGRQTISQLENGKRNITIDIAFAYADIFDATLDYILCRSNGGGE